MTALILNDRMLKENLARKEKEKDRRIKVIQVILTEYINNILNAHTSYPMTVRVDLDSPDRVLAWEYVLDDIQRLKPWKLYTITPDIVKETTYDDKDQYTTKHTCMVIVIQDPDKHTT